jgi:Uma2 family endonuclease
MVAYAKEPFITPEEYLQRERDAEGRSEYWDGVIIAMAGGTEEHDRISGDIHTLLNSQLINTPCEPFTGNMSVYVPAHNRYVYPDVSVACRPEFIGIDGLRVLVNPRVVFEVLSKSTAKTDQTLKRDGYRTLPSLAAYVLVSQAKPYVEVYMRRADGHWQHEVVSGLEAAFSLPAIGCELRLADIYRRVEFANGAESEPELPQHP